MNERELTEMITAPCPFCGATDVIFRCLIPEGLGDYAPEHHFICNCEAMVIFNYDVTASEAVRLYNTRPVEASPNA